MTIVRPHMQKVRSKNTTPELAVRRLLQGIGYRGYRIHYDKLPGKPDVVFTKRRKAIFVHGCFWHGHSCRAGRNTPRSNQDYWKPKLERNKKRDTAQIREIRKAGWDVLVIWECQLSNETRVESRLIEFCV